MLKIKNNKIIFLTIIVLLQFLSTAGAQPYGLVMGKDNGLDIILLIDVSYSLKKEITTIENFVSKVYALKRQKDNIYLITFRDSSTPFGPDLTIDNAINRIKAQIKSAKTSDETFPIHGFTEVFDFIKDEKAGAILFLSDGENSSEKKDELKGIVKFLKKIGFIVFPIYVESKINGGKCPRKIKFTY